ncbi:MAG: hypothetical protein FWG88_11365, partial [Oscillospiraceae bacterium]|nr:hypothetical protein [Oscillospiraceae bacterium]
SSYLPIAAYFTPITQNFRIERHQNLHILRDLNNRAYFYLTETTKSKKWTLFVGYVILRASLMTRAL